MLKDTGVKQKKAVRDISIVIRTTETEKELRKRERELGKINEER